MTDARCDAGPIRFARYAAPPNRLGYCGPAAPDGFGEMISVGATSELRRSARDFVAAFPYLELLAGVHETHDPLAAEVVEAYWVGNPLLSRVATADFGRSTEARFRRRAGAQWRHIELAVPGGVANHAFHVLVASPWVGLMREGIVDEPLEIIDRCRISWGRVVGRMGHDLLVRRAPLVWERGRLVWGPVRIDRVSSSAEIDVEADIAVDDVVSIHWDRVCEVLNATQLQWLISVTASQMAVADRCGRPG